MWGFPIGSHFSNGHVSVNIQRTDVILHVYDVIFKALSDYQPKLP